MKRLAYAALTLLLVLYLASAQAPAPPRTFQDVLTPQATAGTALTVYKSQVEGFLISDGQDISVLKQQNATLSAQLQTLTDRVTKLETAIPTPAPIPVSPLLYMLAVSPNVNYTAAAPLDSATIKGNVYIFTAPFNNPGNQNPTGIAMVNYTLDAVAWPNVERSVPYDFNGGGVAGFWNTTTVPNGKHIITQIVTFTSGGTETDRASFLVAN